MKTKIFDCLEFKKKTQENILRDIRGLTPKEQREYYRKKAEEGPLGKWWKRVKHSASSTDPGAKSAGATAPGG